MKENLSRRQFLTILGRVAGSAVLAGCGPSPVDAQNGSPSLDQGQSLPQETCVESYPGASISSILANNGLPASTEVQVNQGRERNLGYVGPGVGRNHEGEPAPDLQFNGGSAETPINPPITDEVCFQK